MILTHPVPEPPNELAERKVKTARPVAETERARPRRPKKPRPTKADHELWKQLQAMRPAPPLEPDLATLRQAKLNSHPDRGGTAEAFIQARQRYLAATTAPRRK